MNIPMSLPCWPYPSPLQASSSPILQVVPIAVASSESALTGGKISP